ncbi:MAG: dCMP deaminase family protein [Clostridiales bacterium]|nr:dCMP deaminase family protein [Clostridiales bacterium]MDD7432259.1 dCMP deaminase family protein [Clostridiales bacterium]MDY3062233.1 dCMP deaminase family protein [Eubacteriales bacterium]
MAKRRDYLNWDECFMGVALLAAQRSKDPNTRVGACIVSSENRIVSVGYNGMPNGCSDDEFPWEREGDTLNTKYPYVCHAELNAILNASSPHMDGCKLYVSHFPCNECCKAIIQSGIREVIFLSDKYHDSDQSKASRRMMDAAGVRYYQLDSTRKTVTISYEAETCQPL